MPSDKTFGKEKPEATPSPTAARQHFDNKYRPWLVKGVRARVNRGHDATALSIEKWVNIEEVIVDMKRDLASTDVLAGLHSHIGYSTCGLCLVAIEDFRIEYGDMRSSTDKCKKCKLAKIDMCVDEDSIYAQIDQLLRDCQFGHANSATVFDQLLELCRRMIKNLKTVGPVKRAPSRIPQFIRDEGGSEA